MRRSLNFWGRTIFAVLLPLACSLALEGKRRVVVESKADPAYEQQRGDYESYVFSKGTFFPNAIRDGSVSESSFQSIAETLARDLSQRGYLPGDDFKSADLLIVVHWGATQVQEDPMENEAIFETYSIDPSSADYNAQDLRFAQLMDETNALSREAEMRRNARLLGFDTDLARAQNELIVTERERTLRAQLMTERYFVILMAWDNRLIQEKKERKLLWTTRMSIEAAGTNFEIALPLLSTSASDFFGSTSDGIATRVYRRGEFDAELGEIEVISAGDPEDGSSSE